MKKLSHCQGLLLMRMVDEMETEIRAIKESIETQKAEMERLCWRSNLLKKIAENYCEKDE